jgi:hypothetical protein
MQEYIDGKMIKVVKSFAITVCTVSLYQRHHFVGETTNAQARWKCSKSISTSDQYVTLQKYFLHLSLVISNPTHKTKTGTANRWETTNSKPSGQIIIIANHLDKSLLLTDQNCGATIISYLLLFFRKRAFYQPPQTLQKYWTKKHFAMLNHRVLPFLNLILICRITY